MINKKNVFKNINTTKVKDKYTEGVIKLQDVRGISQKIQWM